MTTPDYVKVLKLDKLAMKSKTRAEFLLNAKGSRHCARFLGVEGSFSFFMEQAWEIYGAGD
jgi:hypothetical protein